MGTKSVTIILSEATLASLKQNLYYLCFAKKVNDDYNVVWKSDKKYLRRNTLSWVPEFEVFGTQTYKDSITVQADTNEVEIKLGEMCTLDADGNMGHAVTSEKNPNSITMKNNYGAIHTGINQVCTLNNTRTCTPIYVSKVERASGNIVLTPKESVMVWFESGVETSTIFEEARSNAIEIDLTNLDSKTVEYIFDKASDNWKVIA